MNRTLHSLFFFTQPKLQNKVAFVFVLFFCTFSLAQAQQVSESADLKVASSSLLTNKLGAEQVELQLLQDPSIVFADSNFRFSYNHFALQQMLMPFPIQVSESGEIINYSKEEWESIYGRLASNKTSFDFEKYRTQFLNYTINFIKPSDSESNLSSIVAPPWIAAFLIQQFETQMEYIVKSQFLMGNVCIINSVTNMPAVSNISTKGLPKGSPNAMLAYTSLVNRWLFARPEMAQFICKSAKVDISIFSDPKLLCSTFAPELLPEAVGKKSR